MDRGQRTGTSEVYHSKLRISRSTLCVIVLASIFAGLLAGVYLV